MYREKIDNLPTAPLLFRNATPRISGSEIPGSYDPSLRVWVVDTAGTRQPIITAVENTQADTVTTTKVCHEADDEDIHAEGPFGTLRELVTKTHVQQESDDDWSSANNGLGLLAEVATKTRVQQEADDDGVEVLATDNFMSYTAFPELMTKTDVQQERDDQIRTVGMEFH